MIIKDTTNEHRREERAKKVFTERARHSKGIDRIFNLGYVADVEDSLEDYDLEKIKKRDYGIIPKKGKNKRCIVCHTPYSGRYSICDICREVYDDER